MTDPRDAARAAYEAWRADHDPDRQTEALCAEAFQLGLKCSALLAPPEGWVMVPREPTEEMFDATKPAFKQIDGMIVEMAVARGRPLTPHPEGSPLLRAWKAMLASAPPPPIPSGVEG